MMEGKIFQDKIHKIGNVSEATRYKDGERLCTARMGCWAGLDGPYEWLIIFSL
jgi:hypothetical protein